MGSFRDPGLTVRRYSQSWRNRHEQTRVIQQDLGLPRFAFEQNARTAKLGLPPEASAQQAPFSRSGHSV